MQYTYKMKTEKPEERKKNIFISNKVKIILSVTLAIILLTMVIPQVSAVWYNPFTWFEQGVEVANNLTIESELEICLGLI